DTLTADNSDPSSDSDCPVPLPNFKGIKISPSDIPKLQYNSTVAQYHNWLVDLKTAFDGDLAKFPTSHQKIILALITLDEQLKTTYNSATKASPVLSQHWRKFERWLHEVVLHGGSDKLKLSNEFTAARQTIKHDPKPKGSKPRLSDEEHQHRRDKNLCFNCGYPGHSSRDCSYPFNPNRIPPKDDQAKSQQTQAHSKKRARAQPLHVNSSSNHDV